MKTLLCNDLVINENYCNLSCSYCLTGQSNLKESHREKLIFGPAKRDHYESQTPLKERLDKIIDRFTERFKTPLIKLTGGEIFLVSGMVDLIERCAARFITVVVQTNGVLPDANDIARLSSLKNIVLQISLDSHLATGNSYRVDKPDLHGKVLHRIEGLLKSGIPCEIYTVLTDRNAAELPSFTEWLLTFQSRLQFFPFPVRGPERAQFSIRPDQLSLIEDFVNRYDDFAAILPPRPYFTRLLKYLREGERRFGCHVPRLVATTFSDGVITACPNIWFSSLGNVLENDWMDSANRMGSTGLYKALLAPAPRLDACRHCYTPWDLLSMYFDNEISLEELCESPAYHAPEIRAFLETGKADYLSGKEQRLAK